MNEQRINELAIQAGGIWRGGYVEQSNGDSVYTERKSVDMVDMDLNTYTKLIVQECMTICDALKAEYFSHRKGTMDFDEKHIYAEGESACFNLRFKMKTHFGVKE